MAIIFTRLKFQFTLPRGERRMDKMAEIKSYFVSIHAPAGGATRAGGPPPKTEKVSIHAPAGGATVWLTGLIMIGCVSIHAPAGGATHCADEVL